MRLSFLLLCGLASSAQAEVFMCEENGKKTFSEFPCGTNSVVVKSTGPKVTIKLPLPEKDITYLCSLAMRSWDAHAKQTEQYQSEYENYNNQDYQSSSQMTQYEYEARALRERQTRASHKRSTESTPKILSYITNVEETAKHYPYLYRELQRLQYYINNYNDYSENSTAQRNIAEAECVNRFMQAANYDANR